MLRIPSSARESEAEFWKRFKQCEAQILGALCDAISHGLKKLPDTKLNESPRMADFARWVVACSGALDLSAEQFLSAYSANRNSSPEATLDASPIGPVLVAALEDGELFGTPKEILSDLFGRVDEKARKSKDWPSTGRALTNELKRIAPSLRARGITVERLSHQKSNRGVPYRIGPERKVAESSVTSVAATSLQLETGDFTTTYGQSPIVTSVTTNSPKNGLFQVEPDLSDSSDSSIHQFSAEDAEPSSPSTSVEVVTSRSAAEDWVNRKNGDQ
jgi:hypothetical protein